MLIPTKNKNKKIYIHDNLLAVLLIIIGAASYLGITKVHEVIAKKDSISCKKFEFQEDAQDYYDTRQKGYTKLYVNKDGKVCTTLPNKP